MSFIFGESNPIAMFDGDRKVRALYNGDSLIKKFPRLPPEYTEIEWIRTVSGSQGLGGIVELPIEENFQSYTKVVFSFTSAAGSESYIFGKGTNARLNLKLDRNKIMLYYNSNSGDAAYTQIGIIGSSNVVEIWVDIAGGKITTIANGVTTNITYNPKKKSDSHKKYVLFTYGKTVGTTGGAEISEFIHTDANNSYHYISCRRTNQSTVLGYYDIVNNVFTAGSGRFTHGNDVA